MVTRVAVPPRRAVLPWCRSPYVVPSGEPPDGVLTANMDRALSYYSGIRDTFDSRRGIPDTSHLLCRCQHRWAQQKLPGADRCGEWQGTGQPARARGPWATWTRTSACEPIEVAEERDLVGVYLHEISRTPLLDAAREVELSKAIEAGLYAEHLLGEDAVPAGVDRADLEWLVVEGERAKDLFIRANLRLVVSIARRYVRSGMPMLDLIQEGNTGLVRAVEKFDYERGYKFSTYATWWIRQAISRAIAQQERTVRLPVHLVEDVNRMRNVARQLTRELGGDPEPEQIATALGVTVERVNELSRWSQDTVSLDTPVGDDGDTNLGDLVADSDAPSPEDIVLSGLERQRIEGLLNHLDDRSAGIMRARYGLEDGREHSLTEVASRFSLSRERIRQLEIQALGRLRELARAEGLQAA